MSSVYRYVLILVFTGFISFVQAEQIEVPVMTGHLTDPAELLTPYEHDLLRGIIEGNNKNTGTEVGVLVIPSTGMIRSNSLQQKYLMSGGSVMLREMMVFYYLSHGRIVKYELKLDMGLRE